MKRTPITNPFDQLFAGPMFIVSLIFLGVTAALLHLSDGNLTTASADVCLVILALLYPAYIAETVFHWLYGSRQMRQHIWFLLCPILRLVPRDHQDGNYVWLPRMGWHRTDRSLERKLARDFSKPMIVIALMVLPIVAVEFFWFRSTDSNPNWKLGIRIVESIIWTAFVFEFVIMISIVEKKLKYCRLNWIDIAVILLPLVAFLRAARIGRMMRLKQLSRTARVYRLRGLAIRMWRAIITLDVIDMILRRDPEYRMEKLQERIDEKQMELDWMLKEMERLAERVKAAKRAKAANAANAGKPAETATQGQPSEQEQSEQEQSEQGPGAPPCEADSNRSAESNPSPEQAA